MTTSVIRIHEGAEPSSMVGFCRDLVDGDEEKVEEFFTDRGYRVTNWGSYNHELQSMIYKIGSISTTYFEIKPPLKDKDIACFGAWCLEHVNPYEAGYLVDCRKTTPKLDGAVKSEVLASW